MLKQGAIEQIRKGKLSLDDGYLVVAMRFYPRGLRRDLLDDYRADLAPDPELFKEWKRVEATKGHDEAFAKTKYEERFHLEPEAEAHLKMLAEWSLKRDVYLICQCQIGERCHREILMLWAQKKFGAPIDKVHNEYPRFLAKLK